MKKHHKQLTGVSLYIERRQYIKWNVRWFVDWWLHRSLLA